MLKVSYRTLSALLPLVMTPLHLTLRLFHSFTGYQVVFPIRYKVPTPDRNHRASEITLLKPFPIRMS